MTPLSFVRRAFGGWWRLLDERRRVASGGAGAPAVRARSAVDSLLAELRTQRAELGGHRVTLRLAQLADEIGELGELHETAAVV